MIRHFVLAALLLAAPATALAGPKKFTVRIENLSTTATLKLSDGTTAPAPNSPGLFVVGPRKSPMFRDGVLEGGIGLEALAETGNPDALAAAVKSAEGVVASGVFNTPVGDAKPGPALPGKVYEFTFKADHGHFLHFVTMFAQSNDLFYAPSENGIALFDQNGKAIQGDYTVLVRLWDAGTEVNQEPGLGQDQAPRQATPNSGEAEKNPVTQVKDAYTYPPVAQVIRVTINPKSPLAKR